MDAIDLRFIDFGFEIGGLVDEAYCPNLRIVVQWLK